MVEDRNVVFGLEVSLLLRTGRSCIPIAPLLLLLLVGLLHLRILEGEFQSLQLRLLTLLHILRVIRKYLQTLRNFELRISIWFDLLLLLLLLWGTHRTETMQFHHFLRVVLLVFNKVALL